MMVSLHGPSLFRQWVGDGVNQSFSSHSGHVPYPCNDVLYGDGMPLVRRRGISSVRVPQGCLGLSSL